ncbi:hypothetical protein BD408DRAFT_446467 [Parasitella parasitica]|nr:hypothetical protein BD408DRAFT_446467 [Parasitella parasitica]
MVLLKWGWVLQRFACKFRPAVWKRRYLVLTTMSIHVYKSEKGVISSSFSDNTPAIHVWSNFQNVEACKKSKRSSKHTFMIQSRDTQIHSSLQFKCTTTEEKDRWVEAIDEQLKLTHKMWSSQPASESTIGRSQKMKQTKCILDNPIVPVSVLDKWLQQLDFLDSPPQQQQPVRSYRRGSNCSDTSNPRRNSRRSSYQSNPIDKTEHRHSIKKKRMQKIIENY